MINRHSRELMMGTGRRAPHIEVEERRASDNLYESAMEPPNIGDLSVA